jgi:hypothetical protein
MQSFFGPHAVCVSYQSLNHSWHTDLDYGSYRLSNVEIGLTAGVTGQQGCLLLHDTWSNPTSGVSRGPCKPDFDYELFHYLNWTLILTAYFSLTWQGVLILTADCSVYLIWTHWFWLLIFMFDMGRMAGATGRQGMLLLHGTWSHFWYIQRSVYAHSLICISYKTYEIDYWSLFLSFRQFDAAEVTNWTRIQDVWA